MGDTSGELVNMISQGKRAMLRVHFDAEESGGSGREPIGQESNPDFSDGPSTQGAGQQGGGGTGRQSVKGVIALMLHSALAAAGADDGAAPPPPASCSTTTPLVQESQLQSSQLEEGPSDELESSSSSKDEATSSSSEESLSEGNRVGVPSKRVVWAIPPDGRRRGDATTRWVQASTFGKEV